MQKIGSGLKKDAFYRAISYWSKSKWMVEELRKLGYIVESKLDSSDEIRRNKKRDF